MTAASSAACQPGNGTAEEAQQGAADDAGLQALAAGEGQPADRLTRYDGGRCAEAGVHGAVVSPETSVITSVDPLAGSISQSILGSPATRRGEVMKPTGPTTAIR